jgi:hypothetical protein
MYLVERETLAVCQEKKLAMGEACAMTVSYVGTRLNGYTFFYIMVNGRARSAVALETRRRTG